VSVRFKGFFLGFGSDIVSDSSIALLFAALAAIRSFWHFLLRRNPRADVSGLRLISDAAQCQRCALAHIGVLWNRSAETQLLGFRAQQKMQNDGIAAARQTRRAMMNQRHVRAKT